MAILGIVAEYNPFHYGHLSHLGKSLQLAGAEGVVCVMSGSFTQRGEPALVNKWARAEMAVSAGVDVVLELPFVFAARSSYNFARGSLLTLQKTGVVSHICFGSEIGELGPLSQIAVILKDEPPLFRDYLKRNLSEGQSFARARSDALIRYLNHYPENTRYDLAELLISPNNILALNYLQVIDKERLSLVPYTLRRTGSGYHESTNTQLSSASSIRRDILNGCPLDKIEGIPPFTQRILQREFDAGRGPVSPSSVTSLLRFQISRMSRHELSLIQDMTEGLENRFMESVINADYEDILFGIKTKRYSYSRISRITAYILLNFTRQQALEFDEFGPQYLRPLAFSPKGQKILQTMKTKSELPMVTNVGNLARLQDPMRKMLAFDCRATDIHALLQPRPDRFALDHLISPVMTKPCHDGD